MLKQMGGNFHLALHYLIHFQIIHRIGNVIRHFRSTCICHKLQIYTEMGPNGTFLFKTAVMRIEAHVIYRNGSHQMMLSN